MRYALGDVVQVFILSKVVRFRSFNLRIREPKKGIWRGVVDISNNDSEQNRDDGVAGPHRDCWKVCV